MTTDRESMAREVCEAMGFDKFRRYSEHLNMFWSGDVSCVMPDRDVDRIHAIIDRAKTAEHKLAIVLKDGCDDEQAVFDEASKVLSERFTKGDGHAGPHICEVTEELVKRVQTAERQVAELLEAAKELLASRGSSSEICGHHPSTGHPLNREGKAAVVLASTISRIAAERGGQ